VEGNPHQLVHSLLRILFPGSGQSHRTLSILCGAIENHSGSDNANCVCGFLDFLLERRLAMELCRCFYDDHWRSLLYVQRMVGQNIVRYDGLAIRTP